MLEMTAVLDLHRLLFGAPMAAYARCPICRMDVLAACGARATGECQICLKERVEGVVVLITCGHTMCHPCFESFRGHHRGEAIIDMRPMPQVVVPAEEEIAASFYDGVTDGTVSSGEEELGAEFLPPTLPLPGAPRPKAVPRPPALRPQRPAHPPPPSPVAEICQLPGWARPFTWNFAFLWQGELSAWLVDSCHGEVNLLNPSTLTFVVEGSYSTSPPVPLGMVALWRDTVNIYNRRWTAVAL